MIGLKINLCKFRNQIFVTIFTINGNVKNQGSRYNLELQCQLFYLVYLSTDIDFRKGKFY